MALVSGTLSIDTYPQGLLISVSYKTRLFDVDGPLTTGVTIPRKRPKKTRNPEKDPKKTLFSTKFCLYVTIILFYILVVFQTCNFASLFYVNDRNTAYSSLVCSVPVSLSFGTNAPPGELNVISLLGLSANKIHEYMLVQGWASVVDSGATLNQQWVNVSCLLGYL